MAVSAMMVVPATQRYLFHVHAVGSRGFGNSFPVSLKFADGILFHNYEPDASANDQTENFFNENGLRGQTHPVAVFDHDGSVALNLNYDPYTSSIFSPNPAYRDFYFPYTPPSGDYVFGTAANPVRRPDVPTVRLDTLAADNGLPVDWIAMDTQGAEFEVLAGAEHCCSTTLVGFSTEVEFHPLYQGQKLFGDIAALAARHGFLPAKLTPHPAGSFRRASLGWRGDGFLVAADALFLRSVASVRDGHPDPAVGLRKLAFAALCHGNLEHALEALEAAALLPMPATTQAVPSWYDLLERLLEEHRKTEPLYPVSFTDVYSLDDSLARFAPDCRDQNEEPARTARRFFSHTPRDRFDAKLPVLLSARPTPVEALLIEQGLDQVAGLLRRNRQAATFACCRALGWFAAPSGPLARAGRRLGQQLATEGWIGFYGTGEMFAIADALLDLPDSLIGGIFDGNPVRHGTSLRGQRIQPPEAVCAAPDRARIILCTQSSEAPMCRTLMAAGYRGKAVNFTDLLEIVAAMALDGY